MTRLRVSYSPGVGSQVLLDSGYVWGQSSQWGDYVCDVYNSFGRQGLSEFAELEVNASAFGVEVSGFGPNQSVVPMGQPALIMVNLSSAYHTYNISKAWFTVDGNFTNITAGGDGQNTILWTSTMLPRSRYTLVGYVNDTKNHVTASTPVSVFIETTTTTVTTSTTTTLALGPTNSVENFTYDENGNMLEDGRFKYEYNGMNMLKTVKNATNDAVVEQYWYGPDGQRIKKVSFLSDGKNKTTYYVNSNYEINFNESGARKDTRYVFANGERMAELHQNGSKTYYLNDHLGSSSVLVNGEGQLMDRLTYYPYGEIKTGGSGSKYGYNNKELDLTGLNYYGARYYNPQLKRWTQADTELQNPYDPQGLNRYSYTRNNPLSYKDPSGHYYIPAIGYNDYVRWMAEGTIVVNPEVAVVATALVGMYYVREVCNQKAYENRQKYGAQTVSPNYPTTGTTLPPNEKKDPNPNKKVSGAELQRLRDDFDNNVRPEYWKNQAETNPDRWTKWNPTNLERMQQGKAPIGPDGFPVNLHHEIPLSEGGTNDFGNLEPITQSDHIDYRTELHTYPYDYPYGVLRMDY